MRARVPLWNTPQKSVLVEPDATRGATIGENVYNPDGSLFVPATIATPTDRLAVTLWRLVMEIPANVTALENATGTVGMFAVTGAGTGALRTIEAVAGETTSANENGVAGNPTIGLANLADAGGGTLKKFTRDGKGRLSGTSAATTTDLAEGTNLYFTDARARTAAIASAITDGDTTHAPTGDAVFDALAAKYDKTGGTVSGLVTVRATGLQLELGAAYTAISAAPMVKAASDGNLVNENVSCSTTASWAPRHNFYRGRGTVATPADVVASDSLGGLQMFARIGGAWQAAASLLGVVDGTPGATYAAGRLQFAAADATSGNAVRWELYSGSFSPAADGAYDIGTNALRVRSIYAVNAPRGYIDGLKLQWVSGTALTVSSGAAYIESLGTTIVATSAIAKTSLSLSASTWYHVYLYLNAGTPDIEIVTTAPATAYIGTARSKTGDTSRRYLGSALTTASSTLYRFYQENNTIHYQTPCNVSPFRAAVFNPANTTKTTVSLSGSLPVTGRSAVVRMSNPDTTQGYWIGTSDDGTSTGMFIVTPAAVAVAAVAVSASQDITYAYQAAAVSGGAADVIGYTFER